MSGINKEAAAELPGVMLEAAQHQRKLAHDNVALLKRANDAELELKAYKLARRMEQRGLSQELSFEEKVASLMEAGSDKLAQLEQAVEIAAGGFRLGTVSEPEDVKVAGHGADVLDTFILSDQARS